ncbi:MAG: helix-turn-helix transcriptional regulator [Tistlia sp.]|uniref:helix-turn-helix domain-containing protein n=1 Tax=Tistlia sp. TaxID=3057121 RepID=UPI0034A4542B
MPRGRRPGSGRGGGPNPVDVHVGQRVRQRRTLMGLSQEKLGEALGLTFQQVQKYERGANRIGASRLFDLANILDTDINYFFEDMRADVAAAAPSKLHGQSEPPETSAPEPDPMARRETLELVRAYYRIVNPHVRKRLFEMTKALAQITD